MTSDCDMQQLKSGINPKTNRKIPIGRRVYKRLDKEYRPISTHISICDKQVTTKLSELDLDKLMTDLKSRLMIDLKAEAKSLQITNYHKMKKIDLVENLHYIYLQNIAKGMGFLRYERLNTEGLKSLIITQKHKIYEQSINPTIKLGKGVPIGDLYSPDGKYGQYDYEYEKVPCGYIIRGVDLNGMFNSIYFPEVMENVMEPDYDSYAESMGWSDDDEQTYHMVERIKTYSYWLVAHNMFQTVKDYLDSFRPRKQPESLFDIAANYVTSKKQDRYIPPTIANKLEEYVNRSF